MGQFLKHNTAVMESHSKLNYQLPNKFYNWGWGCGVEGFIILPIQHVSWLQNATQKENTQTEKRNSIISYNINNQNLFTYRRLFSS